MFFMLFDGDDAAEVIPAEEDLRVFEAGSFEEVEVLLHPVGDQHVFQSFPLVRDLGVGIAAAALVVIVFLDEQTVDQ